MAHEVSDWKEPNCSLTLTVSKLSQREIFSREINEIFGEGGGLNAYYRTVEAIAIVANTLGEFGLKYGENFVLKTSGLDEISFDFGDKIARRTALLAFIESGFSPAIVHF